MDAETSEPMISVQDLTRRFGRVSALNGLSFSVNRGEIVGLLGPNGAGKTTTLRILSCFLPASSGSARVAGADVFRQSMDVRRRIGYLPEHAPLYLDMRVGEYLRFRGSLKGLRGPHLRRRRDAVMEQCELTANAKDIIGRLSKGFRQRVGLADCLIHDPDCLILDEPTIGLDPNQIRHVRALIRALAPRHTVLISTHMLSEVEMLCRRVLILDRGRIVASDAPAALMGLMQGDERIFVELNGPAALAEGVEAIREIAGVRQVSGEPMPEGWLRLVCNTASGEDVRERIYDQVSRRGWRLRELAIERRHLEDVFAALTERRPAAHPEEVEDA